MNINEVGVLIRLGMSTEDIKKWISNFPDEVTTEYFQGLGYDHVEAIKCKWRLKQNNCNREMERKKEEEKDNLRRDSSIITSSDFDFSNIIIDTCALGFQKGIYIIENSNKVTVLLDIINEIEKVKLEKERKKKKNKRDEFLLANIRYYAKEMLIKEKYQLIPYECKEHSYTDSIILEYLEQLSKKDRPTLLTADTLLALRAKTLGFEYILVTDVISESIDKNDKVVKSKEKSVSILGVKISCSDVKSIIRKYNPKEKVFLVKGSECTELENNAETDIMDFDYISIVSKAKKHKGVRIFKIRLEKKKIMQEVYKCTVINEIYKLQLHEKILDTAKNNFLIKEFS